jgi:hypothetical protein
LTTFMMSCNQDDPEPEDQTPPPAPVYNADQDAYYSLSYTTPDFSESQTENVDGFELKSGSETVPLLFGGQYLTYYSMLCEDITEDYPSLDNYGMKVSVAKLPYSSAPLSDDDFIALFTEGSYAWTNGVPGRKFSVSHASEPGSFESEDVGIQPSSYTFEILDAIPEDVNGVQTVKVYLRIDAKLLNFDPGTWGATFFDWEDMIFVTRFSNQ